MPFLTLAWFEINQRSIEKGKTHWEPKLRFHIVSEKVWANTSKCPFRSQSCFTKTASSWTFLTFPVFSSSFFLLLENVSVEPPWFGLAVSNSVHFHRAGGNTAKRLSLRTRKARGCYCFVRVGHKWNGLSRTVQFCGYLEGWGKKIIERTKLVLSNQP